MGSWIYLWAFYSVPLIYISVFVPVPCCLDDCGFVVEPEVGRLIPPVPFFFLQITLAIWGFLYFRTNCEIIYSSSVKNTVVSDVRQSEPAISIQVSPTSWASPIPPPTHPSRSSRSSSHVKQQLPISSLTCGCVYMSVLISQFVPPSLPHCVHVSVLYICSSIPVLKIGSSVPFF